MSRWFRFYDDTLNDPKVQLLSGDQYKAWVNFLCLASKNNGVIPPLDSVTFALRVTRDDASNLIKQLCELGLIDRDEDRDGIERFHPHNWSKRQFKTDTKDPTSAKRAKRYRDRKRDASHRDDRDDTVTYTDTRTDTEAETEKKQNRIAAKKSTAYAFDDGVIKLSQKDFETWSKAFSHLDLAAELLSLSKWAESEGKNWFHAVKGALAKRNREVKAAKDKPDKPQPGFRWLDGIEGVI